ncbi:MAG: hypothetical protein ACT4PM_10085 [Gemmatimonadales bacterium]
MARLCLIHWNQEEAAAHARTLRALGHTVAYDQITGRDVFRRIRAKPPDLFVISLDRLPGQGREVAGGLREFKTTRPVPILFVGGTPDKVSKLKRTLPGAHHTSWKGIGTQITRAISKPLSPSAMEDSRWAGYSGTPLPRKLGIKAGATVALANPPTDFAGTLGPLPDGTRLLVNPRGKRDLTVWFVRSLSELKRAIPRMVTAAHNGAVWIAWPKKTSVRAADVSEREVRALGLAAGLVDYKICAIDQDWSGLCFARRRRRFKA